MAAPRTLHAPRAAAQKPLFRHARFDPATESGKAEIVKRITAAATPHWMAPGTWHKPLYSKRQYAVLRKRYPELGLPTRMNRPRPAEAPPLRAKKVKPPKGHKYDRAEYREKRKADVQKAMKDMKRMVDNQRKAGREERKKKREESAALMMNVPLRAPNKKFRLIKLQARREKRALVKAMPEPKNEPLRTASEKKDKKSSSKDSVGGMKV